MLFFKHVGVVCSPAFNPFAQRPGAVCTSLRGTSGQPFGGFEPRPSDHGATALPS